MDGKNVIDVRELLGMFIRLSKIKGQWFACSKRSQLAVKNIVVSFILKVASILTSLLIVPLTINYLNGVQYGIWLTISSIVAWTNFFDLGLANGFKNRFAEAKAREDYQLARQYVSTTYALISIIMIIVFFIIYLINQNIDLASILNVDQEYRVVLHKVFVILAFIFCMNMIANIFAKLLEADQRPAIASAIAGCGQILSLIVIYILTKTTEGSLLNLAIYYSAIPFTTMLISSLFLFVFSRYKKYRPSIRFVRIRLVKNLLKLGINFFLIYLCLIVIFQLINIVLSRECGALAVTQYNVSYKYFSIIYMAFVIVVSPMWSAFTDAYTKKDFNWMSNVLKKFEKMIIIIIISILLLLLLSDPIYKIWVGEDIDISFTLSIGVMLFVFTQIMGSLYMYFINGIGTIKIQLIIYLVFALISYPLMVVCCRFYGTVGVIYVPSLVYLIQAIIGRAQIWKIINQKAKGIWLA